MTCPRHADPAPLSPAELGDIEINEGGSRSAQTLGLYTREINKPGGPSPCNLSNDSENFGTNLEAVRVIGEGSPEMPEGMGTERRDLTEGFESPSAASRSKMEHIR